MQVKAKFHCHAVQEGYKNGDERSVVASFHAVYGNGEENKSFSKWTPAANLTMTINEGTEAFGYFEQGKEYYLTFEKAGQ